jgi:hypothetical protein
MAEPIASSCGQFTILASLQTGRLVGDNRVALGFDEAEDARMCWPRVTRRVNFVDGEIGSDGDGGVVAIEAWRSVASGLRAKRLLCVVVLCPHE